jgi:hypothetical protein
VKRQRWIIIGTLLRGWYLKLPGCGIPNGLFLAWRGRESWCQPCEFVNWGELSWALRRRLAIAGLRAVEIERRQFTGSWERIWVKVERLERQAADRPKNEYEI